MTELYFLVALSLIWLAFASIHDWKTRIVPNWVSFSLIIFALGYRFFYSLFSEQGFGFFYQGLIGLGIFFLIGNLLYYLRMFAGGDAKLMISLGTVLPFSQNLKTNIEVFILFIILFLIVGAAYGLFWSLFLSLNKFDKFKTEFIKKLNKERKMISLISFLGIILMIFGFHELVFFYFGILIFIFPYIYIYAKSVDDSCLIEEISVSKLQEGDWIYQDVKVGKNIVKAEWKGLTRDEIKKIKKTHKKIKIREGIAFAPVFLISFLLLIVIYFFNFNFIISSLESFFP